MLLSRKSLLIAALSLAALAMIPAVGFAQGRGGRGPGGPGGPGGGPGGFGFGGPGGFGGFGGRGGGETMLLLNDQVRSELELTDDQMERIRAASEKAREGLDFREMFRDFRDLTEEQRTARMEEIRTKMTERQEATRKELDTILLPQQSKRLKQIATQQRMRGGPGGGNVNSDFLAEELKLTDEQKQKLAAKAQEVEQKLRERLTKLRKDAEDEILSVLTVEQRATLKDLTGDPFELRFGPPGQRGGQPARDPRGD